METTKAEYVHVVDPDYVEPETVTTTASTLNRFARGNPSSVTDGEGLMDLDLGPEPVLRRTRFDPYEALDNIQYRLDRITTVHIDELKHNMAALRAYITGMER